jgi:hypothetical protein
MPVWSVKDWEDSPSTGTPLSAAALEDAETRLSITAPKKRLGYVSLADYCTINGATDDSAGFLAAWTVAYTESKELVHPGGSLKLDSQITGRFPMLLRGTDATVCEILQNDTANNHHLFDLGGYSLSITNPQTLTSNADKGSKTVIVTDGSGYAAGDTLVVLSNKVWPWSDKASVQGEQVRIASKAGNTLTLREPLDDTYLTSDGALTRKLNVLPGFRCENIKFRNAVPATHTNGIFRLRGFRDITIKDCIFDGVDHYGVMINGGENFNVSGVHFYDMNDNATAGRYAYGVVAYNACRNGRVEDCFMSGGRHLFTTGSDIGQDTTGAGGIPRHITVAHCQATRMTNSCFDTHPEGDQIDFFDCHAYQTDAWGVAIRSPNSSATACTVNENRGYAFWIRADNAKVHGCSSRWPRTGTIVSVSGDPGSSYDGQGLRIGEGSTINPDNCDIRGFTSEDAATEGVYVGTLTDNHVFENLTVRRPGRSGSSQNAVRFAGTTSGHRFHGVNFYNAPVGWFGTSSATDVQINDANYASVTTLYGGGFTPQFRGEAAPTNGQTGLIAPTSKGWTPGGLGVSAGLAYLVRFVPSRTLYVSKIAFAVSTASGTDDAFDVGIYSAAHSRIVSSGAKTSASGGVTGGGMNSTGVKVVDVTATVLDAGTAYYAALSVAATGATVRGANFGDNTAAQLFGTAAGTAEAFSKSSSHPLPASIATPSAGALVPVLAIRDA